MAVWFNLNINAERLGTVEIRRQEDLDLSDQAAIADVWSTYDVRRDGVLVGQVRHLYGHGAWRLLALASDLIADAVVRQQGATRSCGLCDLPIGPEDVEATPPSTNYVVHVCCWYGRCEHPHPRNRMRELQDGTS